MEKFLTAVGIILLGLFVCLQVAGGLMLLEGWQDRSDRVLEALEKCE